MDSHREALEQDTEIMYEHQSLNQTTPQPKVQVKPKKQTMSYLIAFAKGLILFFLLLSFVLAAIRVNRPRQIIPSIAPSAVTDVRISMRVPQPFPKILWVICGEGGPGGLPMVESVGAQHQISVAKASGFEVRVVDLINAYDWLSVGTVQLIRKAKHTSQFYFPVGELLRVALLLEHGGVSAKLDSIIFTQRLDWMEAAFNYDPATLRMLQKESVICHCKSEGSPEILLFSEGGRTTKWFQTSLIIARSDSRLLRQLFSQMVRVLTHSRRSYDPFMNFGWYNNDRTLTMEGFLANLLSFRNRYWNTDNEFCRDYRVLEVNRKEGSFMQTLYVWPRIADLLLRDREVVFEQYGRSKVLNIDLKAVRDQLMEAAKFQSLGDAHPNSLFREIMKAEGNEWMLKPIKHTRQPKICIVSLKPLPFGSHQEPIHRSLAGFEKDDFKHWQAVFFVEGLNAPQVEFSTNPAVTVVNSSEWQGLNLQRAATRHCHPQSIALLFDYDESFAREDALSLIADQFTDRRVFSAFFSAKIGEKILEPNPDRAFRTKTIKERLDNIRQIAINLRAFSIYSYRLIGQFDLHDVWGRYFNRQIPLNTLLQMQNTANNRCEETEMKFHVKRAQSQGKELPRTRVYMPEVVVVMPNERSINQSLPQYAGKHDAHEWCEALEEYYERIKGPLQGFFVLNNGTQFEGLQNRKRLPQLIPNKIHQVWIGNVTLPAFKRQLIDNFKAAYPSWEHHLWTNADITRENFPLTYDLIQTLFQFDKRSPSDKMAMISDIMRLEVLYRHGGFYFDTNYYIFKGEMLEDWRSFEEVFVGQLVPFYKFQRENSLMACVPGSSRFLRLLDHRRLSARNFFSRWANLETGPAYVSFALQGDEEMAPTVFQPAYEWVYPWYYGSNVANACQAPEDAPDELLLFRQRHAYWKNCSQLYSGAFGIQFFLEGGSWMVDRE